jgi:peptidoglycan hydrolase CwlO-like protein
VFRDGLNFAKNATITRLQSNKRRRQDDEETVPDYDEIISQLKKDKLELEAKIREQDKKINQLESENKTKDQTINYLRDNIREYCRPKLENISSNEYRPFYADEMKPGQIFMRN